MSEPAEPSTPLVSPELARAVSRGVEDWEANELEDYLRRAPSARAGAVSASGMELRPIYTPPDTSGSSWEDIGLPGRYPFTRGPYPTMYRGRAWTMRQIAGFGTPDETNQRLHYLIAQGQTGLSIDFDMPTLMGYDSDHEMSYGEVGREGVAIDVLDDMERLFDGIDLETISVSMTINAPAWILLAMYVALAEERGCDLNKLSGTLQNDILKEYIAQKEWIYPVEPSMRLVRDSIAFCAQHMARYNAINISGYHISEAGATAVQEAAFTMANTRAYVEQMIASGIEIDSFAPRLSFFFVAQADFFEEVAKFRALRRVYAQMMKELGATQPESMRMRFHAQTAAATLTRAQPSNNIVRTALQAFAAVLGGTQSLHTNGLDEAYTIPSEAAMKTALRTQQIIAEETNVGAVVDPLGGSYYVEALTDQMQRAIEAYLDKIQSMGGAVASIEAGFPQQEVADSAYEFAMKKARAERTVVGVNKYIDEGPGEKIEMHRLDPASEERQIQRLRAVRSSRDEDRVQASLAAIVQTASDPDANLMPVTIEAVKARVSMGEIVEALKGLWGIYRESPVL